MEIRIVLIGPSARSPPRPLALHLLRRWCDDAHVRAPSDSATVDHIASSGHRIYSRRANQETATTLPLQVLGSFVESWISGIPTERGRPMNAQFGQIGSLVLLLLALFPYSSAEGSVPLYVEDFTTTQYCDTLNTTCWWDTEAGEIRLPPFELQLAGSCDTPTDARGIAIHGDYAFVAEWCHPALRKDEVSGGGSASIFCLGLGSRESW